MEVDPLVPILSKDHQTQTGTQNNVVLRPFFNHPRRKNICIASFLFLVLLLGLFALWPSEPNVKIIRVKVVHFRVHTRPHLAINVSLATTVSVENNDLYSVDYTRLVVAVGYKGKVLGHVSSGGGHVRARGSSYVDATVEFDGVDVLHDWIYLLEDIKKGLIKFDTLIQIDGSLGVFLFDIPLKVKITCEIDVDLKNKTATRQNCYNES